MTADSGPSFLAGLVLGAGSSSRLGQPKQLLDYGGRPLLQIVVDTALAAPLDQVIVAIGGAGPEVRSQVRFGSAVVVENVAYTTGCSSSIVAALAAVDARATGLVLLLGDQPGVTIETIEAIANQLEHHPLVVCRYDDGRGHPFGFDRSIFGELGDLQGDKAVWKLLESGRHPVNELERPGDIPLDVDTWDDYERLLEADR
ncbi:MAG: nucleotidyltransferase family protein [Acidimicrobiales bacterium]